MNTPDIPALRAELNGRKGQWAAIGRAGEFDYSWVVRFASGAIAEPKLSKLVRLRGALDAVPTPISSHSVQPPEQGRAAA